MLEQAPACGVCGSSPAFTLFLSENTTGSVTSEPKCLQCLQTDLTSIEIKPSEHKRAAKNRRMAGKMEKKVASSIGGRVQPASGALPFAKGDVRKKGVVRVECKATRHKQYPLKLEELRKITSECCFPETPAFAVTFADDNYREIETWVAVPKEVWEKQYG